MPYTTPLPRNAQRVIHALGAAVIALYLAIPLVMLLDLSLGPFARARLHVMFLVLVAVSFVGLMWFNRRRLARAAERERLGLAGPPGGANLLVAGTIALGFAAFSLHMALSPATGDRREALNAFAMFLAGGTAAVSLGARRARKRRQWRAERGTLAVQPKN